MFLSLFDKDLFQILANGVFHQKDMGQTSPNKLQGNYLDLLKENFIKDESHIKELDFQQKSQEATDEINSWVAEKTNNKIPQLFSEPLDSQTIVMLVSTLYFKASWNEKFESVRKFHKFELENLHFASHKNLNSIYNTVYIIGI